MSRTTATHQDGASGRESIGPLLSRLRLARGFSQRRLAEKLADASSIPTVSRHEVSRWEREERLPGSTWREWLAVALEAPLEQLEAAVAVARRRLVGRPPRPGDRRRLWQMPTAADLLAVLDHSDNDVCDLAHAWLAGPPDGLHPARGSQRSPSQVVGADAGTGRNVLDRLEARLGVLRRMDDVVGGYDLVTLVDRELRRAIGTLRAVGGGDLQSRALRLVGGYAQLAGWVRADAGDGSAAHRAYRTALHAAAVGRERALAANVLGSLSHQSLPGDVHEALLLARTGHAGLGRDDASLMHALMLHRVALAAAHAGGRREAETALAAAERALDRSEPEQEPAWLYWLDQTEVEAMTGRCLAVLGRPLRAVRLLAARRVPAGPRTATLYGGWLARCYVELGEVEEACRVAMRMLSDAATAGSARAASAVRHLRPILLRYRDVAAVREYEEKAGQTFGGVITGASPREHFRTTYPLARLEHEHRHRHEPAARKRG